MEKIVFETKAKNKEGIPFLKIKEVERWFNYCERLGIDSVAFILYNKNKKFNPYGLIREIKPPFYEREHHKFKAITAFGGSLDKNISLKDIVKEEVKEEAGYIVQTNNIAYLGKVIVSTQMNQYCHLFIVNISNSRYCGQQLEENEAGEVVWLSEDEILNLNDWKSITIIAKAKFKKLIN